MRWRRRRFKRMRKRVRRRMRDELRLSAQLVMMKYEINTAAIFGDGT